MALLGYISKEKKLYEIPTTLCLGKDSNSCQQACTTLRDINSGPLYQLTSLNIDFEKVAETSPQLVRDKLKTLAILELA